jgi:hypothetical protein
MQNMPGKIYGLLHEAFNAGEALLALEKVIKRHELTARRFRTFLLDTKMDTLDQADPITLKADGDSIVIIAETPEALSKVLAHISKRLSPEFFTKASTAMVHDGAPEYTGLYREDTKVVLALVAPEATPTIREVVTSIPTPL